MTRPLPNFITFTGADEKTDIGGMLELANQYPVEFGILFSPSRQGLQPRYPNLTTVYRICESLPTGILSAHICGAHSRRLLSSAATDVDHFITDYFGRAQVNTAQSGIDTRAMRALMAPKVGPAAPWTDFNGQPIHHGDRLVHPADGTTFTAVRLPGYDEESDAWRAIYASESVQSRLVLQIGDRVRAVLAPGAST